MGDFLFHIGASAMCPHGAPLQVVPSQPRVMLSGQPAATAFDQFLVTGCAFTLPGGKPQPCVTAKFLPALKVLLSGKPAVLKSNGLICQSIEQIPAGPPSVTATQIRVRAT
jgi:hypothetical protein